MAKINVLKPFILNFEGSAHKFAVGLVNVPKEIASHWFVAAHAEVIPQEPSPEVEAEVKLETRPAAKKSK
jgi:hypothetical protein